MRANFFQDKLLSVRKHSKFKKIFFYYLLNSFFFFLFCREKADEIYLYIMGNEREVGIKVREKVEGKSENEEQTPRKP